MGTLQKLKLKAFLFRKANCGSGAEVWCQLVSVTKQSLINFWINEWKFLELDFILQIIVSLSLTYSLFYIIVKKKVELK